MNLFIELSFVEYVRTFRRNVALRVGHDIVQVNFTTDDECKALEEDLNAKVKLKSISSSFLNDLAIIKNGGIKFNPNAREEAISKGKKDIDQFLADVASRILDLNSNVNTILAATKIERDELVQNMRHQRQRRRSST